MPTVGVRVPGNKDILRAIHPKRRRSRQKKRRSRGVPSSAVLTVQALGLFRLKCPLLSTLPTTLPWMRTSALAFPKPTSLTFPEILTCNCPAAPEYMSVTEPLLDRVLDWQVTNQPFTLKVFGTKVASLRGAHTSAFQSEMPSVGAEAET